MNSTLVLILGVASGTKIALIAAAVLLVIIIIAGLMALRRGEDPIPPADAPSESHGRLTPLDEQKLQRLSERILTDSSLTDNMDDDQAKRLNNWALGELRSSIEKRGKRTAAMDVEVAAEGEDPDEADLAALRKAMKRVNRIAGKLSDRADADELQGQLQKLMEAGGGKRFMETASALNLENEARALQNMEPSAALERVLSILTERGIDGEA